MTRVVFDTNILYSAILKPGSVPAKAFDLVAAGLVIPCVSEEVLIEYRAVLYRPGLDLQENRRRELLGHISALSLHVTPTQKLAVCVHEPDNRFLECGVEAVADYVVTGNTRHYPSRYENVAIITPRALLGLL
jgi:putative PIN family toxin of toxin-antitoxin system